MQQLILDHWIRTCEIVKKKKQNRDKVEWLTRQSHYVYENKTPNSAFMGISVLRKWKFCSFI